MLDEYSELDAGVFICNGTLRFEIFKKNSTFFSLRIVFVPLEIILRSFERLWVVNDALIGVYGIPPMKFWVTFPL